MKNNEKPFQASAEILQVIADAQRLITYIARNGNAQLDEDVTQVIIEAKYKIVNEQWTVSDEKNFLINYDKLAKIVYPVTVESIHCVIPQSSKNKRVLTKAESAVAWYRRYTLLSLFFLLLIQVYYLFGDDLSSDLHKLFLQRQAVLSQLPILPEQQIKQQGLIEKKNLYDQRIDAKYKLLMLWNQVWSFGGHFSNTMPEYTQKRFEIEKKSLQRGLASIEQLDKLILDQHLYQARIVYFGNLFSADAMLKVLEGYVLPLLYGLLGAFIFVLRSLLSEIKAITYTADCEVRYRLRLTLGALGGMIIGWFLTPEEVDLSASVSSMALAFLMGYNVDVLFSLMDKIIDNIKQSLDKAPTSAPVAKS